MLYSALVALSVLALTYGADPGPPRVPAAPEGPVRQVLVPAGPPQHQFQPELQYNVNLLEPQFQYPGFNYIPEKQPYPRVQPPFVFYAGAAPPGQQFLYRPGAPPGNFLVPQPQPQPQPGVYFGGNPQGPVFVAGYPKPAHIPPIEKDAEEIPGLAGNHPVTGRPMMRPTARKPEKLETLDEPISPTAGEADVLAAADKNPVFPKKSTPSRPTIPALKPGQRFFILNGHPLFSNFPLEGAEVPQPNFPPTLQQSNPEIFVYRQPQYVSELHPQQFDQVPIQDLFLRNSVTGQISDVKPAAIPSGFIQPSQFTDGNFISLNQPNDFRESFLVKNLMPVADAPQIAQQKLSNIVQKEYNLAPVLLKGPKPEPVKAEKVQSRFGKDIQLYQQPPFLQTDPFAPVYVAHPYSDVATLGDYYRYSELKDGKEEDDSVIIDAKVQNDDTQSEEVTTPSKPEEPSLSQAQPAAIALAGTGGVASAAPRGTALAGVKGLAVARPQATAVAGPSKEDSETKTKPKKGRQ